jgi:hypothetical protein
MDVRSRRVSSTHAGRGRRSRRSEIPLSGVSDFVWDHHVGCCGFRGHGFDFGGFFLLGIFHAADIVVSVDFGSGFLSPDVFLVAVTIGCLGAS